MGNDIPESAWYLTYTALNEQGNRLANDVN